MWGLGEMTHSWNPSLHHIIELHHSARGNNVHIFVAFKFLCFLVASVTHFRIFSFLSLSFYTNHNFLVGGETASNFIKEVNIGRQPWSMCILSFSYAKFPLSLICVQSSSYVFIHSVPNSVKTPNININLVYKVFIVAWWACCMKFWCFLVASSTFFVNESINIVQSVVAIAESDSYFSFGEVEALGSQPHFFVRRKVPFQDIWRPSHLSTSGTALHPCDPVMSTCLLQNFLCNEQLPSLAVYQMKYTNLFI